MALSAPQRLLTLVGGAIQAVVGSAAGGIANAFSVVVRDQNGLIDAASLPPGYGPEIVNGVSTEALAAGAYVQSIPQPAQNGVAQPPNIRNADATAGKLATHFVTQAYASGASNVNVFRVGQNTGVSGLTPGDVYLGAVGAVQSAPPTASGSLVQKLGQALSPTNIDTKIEAPIVLA